MEQELQGMYTAPHARCASKLFGRMVVFSLLLHAICTTFFLLPPQGRIGETSVTYLSLDMIAPAPSTEPQETAVVPEQAEVAPTPPPATPPVTELEKLQNGLQQTLAAADSKPEVVQQASMGFGITNGHFSSLSDGKTLREDMREYYLTMLQRFNEKWWLDKNVTTGGARGAVILVSIARDGSIADKNVVESSGSWASDRALLQALEAAGPLPPLPKTYEGNYFKAPLRFVAPLNLMAPFKVG